MKIAVYTIALNEKQHCERWANSVSEADYRVVMDTGSTDDTVELLRDLGVTVYQQYITPWRFDVARNAAMSLVPMDADICISMDMDEFMEPGWRQRLEAAWSSQTTRIGYTYVFNYIPEAEKQSGFYADKIHARMGYEWRRPVHETVFTTGPEVVANDPGLVMNQIQDRSKPTRSNYLPLMKIAHDENPTDSQIAFWYGRELMYANKNSEAITVLERYLALPNSKWDAERSEALIYISRMDPDNAWTHLIKATTEAPRRREVWVEIAQHCYRKNDWNNLLWAALNGMNNCHNQNSYLDTKAAWGYRLPDLGALAAFHLGWKDKAIEWGNAAIELNPDDNRLKDNLKFYSN